MSGSSKKRVLLKCICGLCSQTEQTNSDSVCSISALGGYFVRKNYKMGKDFFHIIQAIQYEMFRHTGLVPVSRELLDSAIVSLLAPV
jgi:hypothetical protein